LKAYCWKYFSAYLIRISPAFETPPPMTKIVGLQTSAIAANPLPKYCPYISAISTAKESPFLTASQISFAVTLSNLAKHESPPFPLCKALLASLTTPVAEAYCSKQPLFPHQENQFHHHLNEYDRLLHLLLWNQLKFLL